MTKSVYKRQKLVKQPTNNPSVAPTVYEAPKESLLNFPSSIMNGITKEGGLVSLTFKSITCAKLVEGLDWMREAIIKDQEEFDPIRINENDHDANKILGDLKQEIQHLKEKPHQKSQNDDVNQLQSKFNESLIDHESLHKFGEGLIKQFEIENPTKSINVSNERYSTVSNVPVPGIKVDNFEDANGLDLSIYERNPTRTETVTNEAAHVEKSSDISDSVEEIKNEMPVVAEEVNYNIQRALDPIQSNAPSASVLQSIPQQNQLDLSKQQENYY